MTLSLFASLFTYSQVDKGDFTGVWQDKDDSKRILIVYFHEELDILNFYNYKLNEVFNTTETFISSSTKEVNTEYINHLTGSKYLNKYYLKRKKLVRNAEGKKQIFKKLN